MSGAVEIDGRDTLRTDPATICRVAGMVFQDPEGQAVLGAVDRDVAFGLECAGVPPAGIPGRVREALALAGAGHLAGRAIAELSGGELQRVALAAVLAPAPRLLLLDEPSSQLDDAAALALMTTLRRLADDAGVGVVIAEHRGDRAGAIADRVAGGARRAPRGAGRAGARPRAGRPVAGARCGARPPRGHRRRSPRPPRAAGRRPRPARRGGDGRDRPERLRQVDPHARARGAARARGGTGAGGGSRPHRARPRGPVPAHRPRGTGSGSPPADRAGRRRGGPGPAGGGPAAARAARPGRPTPWTAWASRASPGAIRSTSRWASGSVSPSPPSSWRGPG